jgi:hypothetical protein
MKSLFGGKKVDPKEQVIFALHTMRRAIGPCANIPLATGEAMAVNDEKGDAPTGSAG